MSAGVFTRIINIIINNDLYLTWLTIPKGSGGKNNNNNEKI